MNDIKSDIVQLNRDLADRLRTLGAMFTDFGTEEGAERLLGALVADDGRDFHDLIGRYDLPKFPELGMCVWVREVLDSVLLTPNVDEHCALRSDLTPHERIMVLALAGKHGLLITEPLGGQAIAPGPFLDALNALHLVNCEPDSSHSRPLNLLGPHRRFCV